MAFQGTRYNATFDQGDNTTTEKVEVFALDDTDATKKVRLLFPSAQNIVVSSAG